jgi:hypothetical protein
LETSGWGWLARKLSRTVLETRCNQGFATIACAHPSAFRHPVSGVKDGGLGFKNLVQEVEDELVEVLFAGLGFRVWGLGCRV